MKAAVAATVLAGIAGCQGTYVAAALSAPRRIDPADAATIRAVASDAPLFVEIEVRTTPACVFVEYDRREVAARTFAAQFAGASMLVRHGEPTPPAVATGLLEVLPDADARNCRSSGWFDAAATPLLPWRVDTTRSRGGGLAWLAGAAAIAALAAWGLTNGARRLRHPWTAPSLRPLLACGRDPRVVASEIDEEVRAHRARQPIPSAILTPHWLVVDTPYCLEVVPLVDVIWANKHVLEHRKWGVIKTGESHSVQIHTRDGRSISVSAKTGVVGAFLSRLGGFAPWAYVGHSEELRSWWNDRREELIAAVDARREEFASE